MTEASAHDAVAIFGFETCDTCRKARHWLERFGPAFHFVDVQRERPDPALLRHWAETLGGWSALVDRGGSNWSKLLPQRQHPQSDPEWTLLIREHPEVLRHPVAALADGRVAVGFTGGSYERLFGKHKASP